MAQRLLCVVTVLAFTWRITLSFLFRGHGYFPFTVKKMSAKDEYTVVVLGDLHLDPRYMEDHLAGRNHLLKLLEDGKRSNSCVVSLGDLGESKSVDETRQLYAGTSKCLQFSREYLDGFNTPVEVIGGNHDLEGIDEYSTDAENLQAFLKAFDKPTPYFKR